MTQTPGSQANPFKSIAIADCSHYKAGNKEQKRAFIDTVGQGLADIGFFALINHGVDQNLIDRGYTEMRTLFERPKAFKSQYIDPRLNGQRGYTPFGKEHAKQSEAPDLKEFWHIGREGPNFPPNIWPNGFDDFRRVFTQLFAQLDQCAHLLLEAAAIYLGEDKSFYASMVDQGNSILRLIHYPPIPEDRHPKSIRAEAHEDINLITLLCEATDDGLELLTKTGEWLPIKAVKGQIVVDAGDMLQNISNGFYKSTTHRVVNPALDRSRRFSIPYFVHPRSEIDLTPTPTAVAKTTGKADFPTITAGEYLAQRLAEIGLKT